jgi:hypothetical protein
MFMGQNTTGRVDASHALSLDIGRPRMAKAVAKNLGIDWRRSVAEALQHAVASTKWSDKEAAGKVSEACGEKVDPGDFSKWMTGERRPHIDRILAVPELRRPFVIALARLVPGTEIVEEIRFKTAVGQ